MKRLAAVAAAFALAPNKVRLSGTYPVASRNATIAGIVAGADKRLWFTEFSGDAVGAITTSGVARTWATGTRAQLWGIAARGKTVYTGGNGVLFKVTLRGKFVAQPVHGARVGDMIEGPGKNL